MGPGARRDLAAEIPYRTPGDQIDRRLWKHYLPATTVASGKNCDLGLAGGDEDAIREEAAREELLEFRKGNMPSAGPSFRRNYIPPPDAEQEPVHTEF